MLEVANVRLRLARLSSAADEHVALMHGACNKLGVREAEITSIELRRRAVDARKRQDVMLVCTCRVSLAGGPAAEKSALAHAKRDVTLVEESPYQLPGRLANPPAGSRPIVVGAGCAGLFCALALASAGLEPLLVERGDDAARRTQAVRTFERTGELDPESNIQFGLGGAGTFSDGKLTTGTKSPAHRLILEALVAAGADESILWDAKPHVGSDVLPGVVTRLLERIEELGGEVRLRCRLVDVDVECGRVRGVTLAEGDGSGAAREEHVAASAVVLACGHSARDVYALLGQHGVSLERKTFAMGVRIEHEQAAVDRALLGDAAGNPLVGPAAYKLVAHLEGGRSAFSFCMCPGGYVVAAASEPGGVVTNGMSLAARAGTNANSGLLANVGPGDLPGDDPLAGIELQRRCERAAFEAGGGAFAAPAQLVGDFLQGRPSTGAGGVTPTYPRGVVWGSVAECLPAHVTETIARAIPQFERSLRGFSAPDAVLTGVETRSSSPVRVVRDEHLESTTVRGIFPAGEGAGYAGGIMSAATDGLRCAEAVVAARLAGEA